MRKQQIGESVLWESDQVWGKVPFSLLGNGPAGESPKECLLPILSVGVDISADSTGRKEKGSV